MCVEAGVEKTSVRHKICLTGLNEREKLKEEEKRGNAIFYVSKLSGFLLLVPVRCSKDLFVIS